MIGQGENEKEKRETSRRLFGGFWEDYFWMMILGGLFCRCIMERYSEPKGVRGVREEEGGGDAEELMREGE